MTKETKIAPPNSLLFVMDKDNGQIPRSMDGKALASTASCIAIGTLSEVDGETMITLTDEEFQFEENAGLRRVFAGVIPTPQKVLEVCTVRFQVVLSLPVQDYQCKVEVWTNDEAEPDKIYILIK